MSIWHFSFTFSLKLSGKELITIQNGKNIVRHLTNGLPIFAGLLESANCSILAAHKLF